MNPHACGATHFTLAHGASQVQLFLFEGKDNDSGCMYNPHVIFIHMYDDHIILRDVSKVEIGDGIVTASVVVTSTHIRRKPKKSPSQS